MRRFDHYSVGVCSGSEDMFSAFADGSAMWTGEGPRLEVTHVRFPERFVEPPVVHLSPAMWDIDSHANQRADLRSADITNTGFRIEFRTWGDTRVARIRVSWLAIGPLQFAEDFDA